MLNLPYRFHLACGLTILLGVLALAAAGWDIYQAGQQRYSIVTDVDAPRKKYEDLFALAEQQRPWTYGLAGSRVILGLAFLVGGVLAWQGQGFGRNLIVPAFVGGFFFVALAGIVLIGEQLQRKAILDENYTYLLNLQTPADPPGPHGDPDGEQPPRRTTATPAHTPARAAEIAYFYMPHPWLEIGGTIVLLVGKVLCFVVGLGYFTRNDVRAYLEPGPAWMYEKRPAPTAT